ncbi:MAG: OmpA family protein [Bacteroidales bacterium]|nr:OmpA family protein [Lentimicrobiaceae bacterium]MDD5695985.1 OmpA family protein [Bacteroidales bacterium]
MKSNVYFVLLAIIMSVPVSLRSQNEDAEGCKDHPLFNRMTNFFINSCEFREFDAYSFPLENSTDESIKTETVEGKYYYYEYFLQEESAQPSALQIYRNYENALRSINATIIAKVYEPGNSYNFLCAKIAGGTRETWVRIDAGDGARTDYYMTIVEKDIMEQVIQADEMLNALNADGYIALNILFDTGKSAVKTESEPIIEQIYILLSSNPALQVSIEGHTDNVGNAESNKTLSEARAKAVKEAIIAKGIGSERLTSVGWGQEKPVADNRTEEGRAKNRRVEIVKK